MWYMGVGGSRNEDENNANNGLLLCTVKLALGLRLRLAVSLHFF